MDIEVTPITRAVHVFYYELQQDIINGAPAPADHEKLDFKGSKSLFLVLSQPVFLVFVLILQLLNSSFVETLPTLGFGSMVRVIAMEQKTVILQSVITCPVCGHKDEEIMPANACVHFYHCKSCGTRLSPAPGDCCVFCSYGSVKCPPVQMDSSCCRGV